MTDSHNTISFSKILLQVVAGFYLMVGIVMFFSPDSFLIYWSNEAGPFPYTASLYTGATNIALSFFILDAVYSNKALLRPIIFLIILGIMSVYAMFTISATVYLSLFVYTWRLSSLALLIVALVIELTAKKKNN